MALIFPTSASLDDTYQSGSSATYKWNGKYWVVSAPVQVGITVATASYSERTAWVQSTPPGTGTGSLWYSTETGNTYIKAGTEWVPSTNGTINAVSASLAISASFAATASFLLGSITSASFAATASYVKNALTASYISGSTTLTTAAYLSTIKNSTLGLGSGTYTRISGFGSPIINTVPSAWDATNGIFTVPVAGYYDVFAQFGLAQAASSAVGKQFNVAIYQNSTNITQGDLIAENTTAMFRSTISAGAILSCSVGDQITIQVYQDMTSSLSVGPNRNIFTIKQLPFKI